MRAKPSARYRACSGWIARRSAESPEKQNPPGWPPGFVRKKRPIWSMASKIPHPGSEAGGHPLGVRDPPRVDREPGSARAQRHEHLSGSGREVWVYPPLQLGQAVRRGAEGPRTGALRRARRVARRRGPGRFWSGCTDAAVERQISPAVSVRDDAQVLRQKLSQGGVEGRSGKLGAPTRGSVPHVRRFGRLRRARQLEAGCPRARSVRTALQPALRRDARPLRRGR